jgi:hypothetical protein
MYILNENEIDCKYFKRFYDTSMNKRKKFFQTNSLDTS